MIARRALGTYFTRCSRCLTVPVSALQVLPSSPPPPPPSLSLSLVSLCVCSFSSESSSVNKTNSFPTFEHKRAEELFKKITQQLSGDEVKLMYEQTLLVLGKPIREHEFYIHGFGGKKFKKANKQHKGAAAEEQGEEDDDEEEDEPGKAAAAASQTKTAFDLVLAGFDDKAKIKVIKEIRAIAGLGLKEAKELVESAPKVIKKDMKKEEAEELKKKLEEIGAKIDIV